MYSFWQDVRYGFRMLAKRPGLTVVIVLSMALGIGANATIYSFVDALLFSPFPYENIDELVTVYTSKPDDNYSRVSYPDYEYYRDHNDVFTGLSACNYTVGCVKFGDRSEFLFGEMVSDNFFPVLGANAAIGRTFLPEENAVPDTRPVTVISHGLWQRRFHADPNILQETLLMNGRHFTIVGVMPETFKGTLRGLTAEFWIPLMMYGAMNKGLDDLANRKESSLVLIGRLKSGQTLAQAQSRLAVQARQLARAFPETNKDWSVSLIPTKQYMVVPQARYSVMGFMALLMGVVMLVLFIACANVVNLLLARNTSRNREIAIRLSLGASRWRLVRQLLVESITLAMLGGLTGLFFTLWINDLLLAAFAPVFPIKITLDIGFNPRVLQFTLALSFLTGIVFGLVPALHASKLDLVSLLKDESGKGGFRRSRIRNLLVITQMGVSLVLLIAACLLGRSLLNAQAIDPGFDVTNRLTMTLSTDFLKYPEPQAERFFKNVDQRVRNLPGVLSIAWADRLPLDFNYSSRRIVVEGYEMPTGHDSISIDYNMVSPDYFRTIGMSTLKGRNFTGRDDKDAPKVVVINKAMADHFWLGKSPIGQRIHLNNFNEPPITVIGVVETGKYYTLGESPRMYMHLPFKQYFQKSRHLIAHTQGNPSGLIPAMRQIVTGIDNNIPIIEIKTLKEQFDTVILPQRVASTVLGVMGLAALILASIGIYGVMSYSVSQRTQEIGIRMALGANFEDVVKLVTRQGMILTGIGVAFGLIASAILSGLLTYLLFDVSAVDPAIFFGVSFFLILIAYLACYIPARRAAKVDPMVALRYK